MNDIPIVWWRKPFFRFRNHQLGHSIVLMSIHAITDSSLIKSEILFYVDIISIIVWV